MSGPEKIAVWTLGILLGIPLAAYHWPMLCGLALLALGVIMIDALDPWDR